MASLRLSARSEVCWICSRAVSIASMISTVALACLSASGALMVMARVLATLAETSKSAPPISDQGGFLMLIESISFDRFLHSF